MMWAVDSPTLLRAAADARDWSVLLGALTTPTELAGTVVGNLVAGHLYDRKGHLVPGRGVVCEGATCFRGTFIMTLAASCVCLVLSIVLACVWSPPPPPASVSESAVLHGSDDDCNRA